MRSLWIIYNCGQCLYVCMYAPENNANRCQLILAGLILGQRYITKKVAYIKISQIEHRIPIENGISWGIGD